MSFMYITNKKGPKIEPCGSPVVIVCGDDLKLSISLDKPITTAKGTCLLSIWSNSSNTLPLKRHQMMIHNFSTIAVHGIAAI